MIYPGEKKTMEKIAHDLKQTEKHALKYTKGMILQISGSGSSTDPPKWQPFFNKTPHQQENPKFRQNYTPLFPHKKKEKGKFVF